MKPIRHSAVRSANSARAEGFSLIEMLITLAIILILFTMMYGFGSRSNQMSQKKKCQSNLQKMYIALQIYSNDSKGKFPVVTNATSSEDPLDMLVPRYSSDTAIFVCPGSKDSALPAGESLRKGRISYAYYMGRTASDGELVLASDKQVDNQAKQTGDKVFSADGKYPGNNHHKYGGTFLYCDGGMKSSPSAASIALPLSTNVVLLNPKP
jgi:prepilin-type N-terminal cleavage/methylation domain-containing protein